MIVVREFIAEDWPYISRNAHAIPCYDTCGVVCENEETGELYGAFVFDHLAPTSARLHLAMTHPLRAIKAGLLNAAAEFIFVKKCKRVVIAIMPESRRAANRFGAKNGWPIVGRITNGFDDNDDAIIREYRVENCTHLDREVTPWVAQQRPAPTP